jgi:hypothetical protein
MYYVDIYIIMEDHSIINFATTIVLGLLRLFMGSRGHRVCREGFTILKFVMEDVIEKVMYTSDMTFSRSGGDDEIGLDII